MIQTCFSMKWSIPSNETWNVFGTEVSLYFRFCPQSSDSPSTDSHRIHTGADWDPVEHEVWRPGADMHWAAMQTMRWKSPREQKLCQHTWGPSRIREGRTNKPKVSASPQRWQNLGGSRKERMKSMAINKNTIAPNSLQSNSVLWHQISSKLNVQILDCEWLR